MSLQVRQQPVYAKGSEMVVILKICSLDKLMTLKQACRTFVGKKLGADILATETKKYIKPWTIAKTDNPADLKKEKPIDYTTNMRILEYETGKEHIFPYLVQYNESFYDLLARTTNRWGEFMYFENDKLHIGYNKNTAPTQVSKDAVKNITFFNFDSKKLKLGTDGAYDYEADNSSLAGKPLQKSPYYVRGQMGLFGGEPDKWIMKQFPGIFMNEKNLPTMMADLMFENSYYLAMKEGRTAKRNADHDKKFFKNYDATSEQCADDYTFQRDYDEKKTVKAPAFQQFTELDTKFTGEKYKSILEKELTTGQDAIYIDYDTRHPNLRLGDIVSFAGENYIVVEVTGGFDADHNLVFQVVATAQDEDKLFYPAVIPAGHVRYTHPQMATITDAKDPTRRNRARVMYSWETIVYDKKGEITEDTKDLSSPWLTFASGQQGHPMAGKHYEGDQVMVGFEDGNVERPFVIGALAEEDCRHVNIDSILTSQGMHKLILSDGTGAGMEAFLGGAISPLSKTFMNFAPGVIPFLKWDKTKYFEGGFELSDYYGTYRFTGSTDGRNVTIASNWGDMKVKAFTGINISSPNGDVKIKGKNVTIKAGNNLKLISGKNVNYKLWETKNNTSASSLQDMAPQVDNRLAEVAHPLDLSIVRSAVEIFFRPVEGSLTVKSNRFLELEAGNSSCHLPTKAYSVDIQDKLQDEVNQKVVSKTIALGQEIPILFEVMKYVSFQHMQGMRIGCSHGVEMLSGVESCINDLKAVANDPNQPVCKTYEELKDRLWKQTADTDWTEADFGINDNVAIKGDLDTIVEMACVKQHPAYHPGRSGLALKEIREEIVETRKELRGKLIKKYQIIRKWTYRLTHFEASNSETYITSEYQQLTGKRIPENLKKMFLTAISREKCPLAGCYNIPDKFKSFRHDLEVKDSEDETIYLMRLSAMILLEELGFTDDIRSSATSDGYILADVPPKPQSDKMDAGDSKNIMNNICWKNYVQSLNAMPLLSKDVPNVGDPLKKVDPGFWETQLDKMKFWKGSQEIKSWGDGKDGQILFGSGNDTYALNDSKFEKVAPPDPTITSVSDNDTPSSDNLLGPMTKVREILSQL